MKDLTHHVSHYLPLLGILAAGIAGIVLFPQDRTFQGIITVAVSSSYVAWGIVHHHIHKDLHFSVVLEYIIIGLLGVVIIFSILFRV